MEQEREDQNPLVARKIAIAVLEKASDEQRLAVATWAQEVLVIRASKDRFAKKGMRIVEATHRHGLTKNFLQQLWKETKRVGWDDRTRAGRGVVAGTAVGVAASLAGPMAGVAAFGTAIGLPVIVLGAGGGALVAALIEESEQSRKK